ncbi:vinorine synthase-like [Juglans regia]|uniref:Vinorine synthase-like n=1 Tax=Juglans regia TaxID=51240 RepID=A0A6P9F529_JUGRE|nr:vinorine synthase-like [Juglans regia]
MEVEIISKEKVKPSSPTPYHRRYFKLSFLDQFAPPFYTSTIFFYHSNYPGQKYFNPLERSSWLKKSLAETLTRFYPLAGKLNFEDVSVDCNDEGVNYIQARVACKLSQVVDKADGKALLPLLPFDAHKDCTGPGETVLLAIQYSIFECGGVAIGVIDSHKIADGTSLATLINAWASTSRGASHEVTNPSFDASIHFPRTVLPEWFSMVPPMEKERLSSKRFVFKKSSIDALRKEASVAFGADDRGPSRVEAVSAFIWWRLMTIARSKPGGKAKQYAVRHAVNLRQRMVPRLSEHSFGNVWNLAITAVPPTDVEKDYPSLTRQIRNSFSQVSEEYVKHLQDADAFLETTKMEFMEMLKFETEFCNFTSWCSFPVYDIDFGWGKPTWVACPTRPYKNVILIMRSRDGEGIETWVNLEEEDMAMFERDPKLLQFIVSSGARDQRRTIFSCLKSYICNSAWKNFIYVSRC